MLTNVLVVLKYVAKYVSMEELLDPCRLLAFAQPLSWPQAQRRKMECHKKLSLSK